MTIHQFKVPSRSGEWLSGDAIFVVDHVCMERGDIMRVSECDVVLCAGFPCAVVAATAGYCRGACCHDDAARYSVP